VSDVGGAEAVIATVVGIGQNASLFGLSIGFIAPVILIVFVVLAFIFGATTLDSSALTLASVATEEQEEAKTEPARWHRLFWAFVLAGVSLALMYLGGLKPLQTASIVVALPLMGVMVIMTMSFFRWLKQDHPEAGAEKPTVSVSVSDAQPAKGK
jgi:BCCT family betaine/carnitine transporter